MERNGDGVLRPQADAPPSGGAARSSRSPRRWPSASTHSGDSPEALNRWVLLAFTFVFFYAFPYFGALRSANELPRVLVTQEIVERGSLALDRRLAELGSRFDIAPTADGRHYPNKAPGPSFVAAPFYAVGQAFGFSSVRAATWICRAAVSTLPAVLFLWLFYRQSALFAPTESARRLALIAFALGSPFFPYALLFMSHAPAAVAAGSAFCCAVAVARGQTQRPTLTAGISGAAAGASVMMDYQSFIAAAAIGVYMLVRAPRRGLQVAAFALGAVPSAVILALYHQAAFGSPFMTGYNLSNPIHNQGFMGIVGPNATSFFYTLLDPSNGLFVLAPWSLLALVGFGAIMARPVQRQRVGAEAITCLAVALGYVLFLGCLVPEFARAGWSVGPRYMTVALPFVAWLAAAGFAASERMLGARILSTASVLAAVIVFAIAATTYPHWPEALKNPLWELSLPLLGRGYAVHSLGTVLGLRGLSSLLPLYLFILAFVAWTLRGRWRVGPAATACVLALALVAAQRFFPSTGPYAQRAFGFVTGTWEPK